MRACLPGALVIAGFSLLAACAASRPEPAGIGAQCDASADCIAVDAAAAQCSFVRLCVSGRCEAIGDAGTPLSRIVLCTPNAR